MSTVTGTSASETLNGTSGADTITGNGGNDTVNGGGGTDTITTLDGNDTIYGTDSLNPTASGDIISSGGGSDFIAVTSPASIDAGAGDDIIEVTTATITSQTQIVGGADNDTLIIGSTLGYSPGTVVNQGGSWTFDVAQWSAAASGIETLQLETGQHNQFHLPDPFNTPINLYIGQIIQTTANVQTLDFSAFAVGANSESLRINGSSSDNVITGWNGGNAIYGGDGNDTLTGGNGIDYLSGDNGNDTLNGGGGDDYLIGGSGNDTLNGGTGTNTALFGYNENQYQIAFNGDGSVTVTGSNSDGTDTLRNIQLLSFFNTNQLGVLGTNGDDTLVPVSGAGFYFAGGGNDALNFGASFTASSVVDGGAGTDTLNLSGNYSTQLTITSTMLSNVELIAVGPGYNYNLKTDSTFNPTGTSWTYSPTGTPWVFGGYLGAGNTLTFDASASTGNFTVSGGAGNDVLTGGSGDDVFDLSYGGNDTVVGGAGNDGFAFGGTFTSLDSVDGGAGFGDQLILRGDYSSQLTITNAMLRNVEGIYLNGSFNYNLKTDSSFDPSTGTLVDGSGIGAGNSLNFDGSASQGFLNLTGSAGNDILTGGSASDTLTGGAGNDTFSPGTGNDTISGGDGDDTANFLGNFNGNDSFNGGNGNDTLALNGNYSSQLNITGAMLSNVENITLAPAGSNYNLKADSTLLANGASLSVVANLSSSFGLTFDGSASTSTGSFNLTGGSGNDVLTGGSGNDTFTPGTGNDTISGGDGDDTANFFGNFNANDSFSGGNGNDTLNLSGTYSGLTITSAMLSGVESIGLTAGSNYNFTASSTLLADNTSLTVGGTALTGANGLTFNGGASITTTGVFNLFGGAGNDVLTGGAGNDFFTSGAGNDQIFGGNGNDIVNFGANFAPGDLFNGGGGNDTLNLTGNYSNLLITGGMLQNVESIVLGAGGFNYNLQIDASVLGSGQTLGVNAGALTSGNSLVFGGASSSGNFNVTGGAGNDTLVGGGGNDTFTLNVGGNDTVTGGSGNDKAFFGGAFSAGDSFNGGDGYDTLYMAGAYTSQLNITSAMLSNVEEIVLNPGAGYVFNLKADSSLLGSGGVLNVNGTGLLAANTLTFDGSASVGNFNMFGGAGNDTLTGGSGFDNFTGGAGNDTIDGGGGINTAVYSANASAYTVTLNGDGSTTVSGPDGTDTLRNVQQLKFLDKTLIFGTSGNDTITPGRTGTFVINGEGGSDTVRLPGDLANYTVSFDGSGNTVLTTSGATYTLTGIQKAQFADVTALIGSDGGDTLTGTSGNDGFIAGLGNDTINANGGNDTAVFSGNASAYTVTSGGGNATVSGPNGNDTLNGVGFLQFADGIVTVGGSKFTGTSGDDTLLGTPNNDLFDLTQGGNDTVNGGAGIDMVVVSGTGETSSAAFNPDGSVTVTGPSGSVTLHNVELLKFAGDGQEALLGTDSNDALGYLPGATQFQGRAGDDTITPGVGNFYIDGGTGFDTLILPGSGQNVTDSGFNDDGSFYINGAAGNYTGDSIEIVQFNDAKVRLGTLGNDVLLPIAGATGYFGGAGDDTITPGSISDYVDIKGGAGNDTVVLPGNFSDYTAQYDGIQDDGAEVELMSNGVNYDLNGVETIQFNDATAYLKVGTSGNDTITPGAGRFIIDGNGGNDTVVLPGPMYSYTLGSDTNGNPILTTEGSGYILQNIATVQFSDYTANFISGGATGTSGDDAFLLTHGPANGTIIGGGGNDVLVLSGIRAQYTVGSNGSNFTVNGGNGINLTLNGISFLQFDDGQIFPLNPTVIAGTSGNDTLTGTAKADIINAAQGGTDTISGLGGDDIISLGGALIAADVIDGGGDNFGPGDPGDTLNLGGIYSSLTFGATTVTNIETIGLAGGNTVVSGTPTPNVYNFTLNAATDPSGHFLQINANNFSASNTMSINGSAVAGDLSLSGGIGNDTLIGGSGNDSLRPGAFSLTASSSDVINGGGGTNRLALGSEPQAVSVDLNQVGVSQIVTTNSNSTTASLTISNIQNVKGTAFGDTLTGDGNANVLIGNGGNDTINGGGGNDIIEVGGLDSSGNLATSIHADGGSGTDTLSFMAAVTNTPNGAFIDTGVTFDLSNSGAQVTGFGTVTATGFENLQGTQFDDTLTGDANDNVIYGGSGDNILNGGAGNDTLYADGVLSYSDQWGQDTTPSVVGGTNPGSNILRGGAGNDTLNGGSSDATAAYDDATSGVTVSLAVAGPQNVGGGDGTDTLINIQNLLGSGYNDTLTGNSGDNRLQGGAGDDIIDGGDGNDAVFYGDATSGVTVSLAISGPQAVGGGLGSDTLSNIEYLVGSDYNDTLTGDGGNNVLVGELGDDTLIGGAGNDTLYGGNYMGDGLNLDTAPGNDILIGGTGNDTLIGSTAPGSTATASYADATSGVTVSLAISGPQNVGGGLGTDTLVNITNLIGSNYADTLTGNSADNKFTVGAGDTVDGGGGNDTAAIDLSGLSGTFNSGPSGGVYAVNQVTIGTIITLSNVANVSIIGNGGNNSFTGGAGSDSFVGGSGNDTLDGGTGANVLSGGGGNDTISDSGAGSTIDGGSGDDALILDRRYNTGNIVLTVGPGQSTPQTLSDGTTVSNIERGQFVTGSGDDTITMLHAGYDSNWAGSDIAIERWDGGAGNDTAVVDFSGETLGIVAGPASGSTYTITENSIGDVVVLTNVENYNITGSSAADTMTTGAGNDVLSGGDGGDTLDGGAGTNVLSGGGGNDAISDSGVGSTIDGGDGDDALILDRHSVTGSIILTVGPDQRTPQTLSDGTTVSNIERGQFVTGSGNDTITMLHAGYDSNWAGSDIAIERWDAGGGNDTAIVDFSDESSPITTAISGGTYTLSETGIGAVVVLTNVENYNITGGSGGDTLTGGGGNDRLKGGAGDDILNGGGGNDTAVFSGNSADYTIGVSGGNYIVTGPDGSDTLSNIEFLAFDDVTAGIINGTSGNDNITGTSGADLINITAGGNDTVTAGAGNDLIVAGGALTAADKIDGGIGNDTLYLDGNYSLTLGSTTVTGVETFVLAGGHNYNIVTNNATVATGAVLTVDASAVGVGNSVTIDGTAETTGTFVLIGGAGTNTLTGGTGADTFIGGSGANILTGGAGDDSFEMGADLKATDKLSGGTGNDTLYLDGGYNLTFNSTTITSVESIVVAGGQSYNLTSDNATVAAGKSLVIDSTALNSDDSLTFNGAAETDGTFVLNGGAGTDIFTGGTGSDTLNGGDGNDTLDISRGGNDIVNAGAGDDTIIAGAAFTAADVIEGGDGNDTLTLSGTTSVTLGSTTLHSVENITLGAGFNYSLTTNNSNVATGATLVVDASAVGVGNSVTFSGAAETNGLFSFIGGAGTNTLTGGALGDAFYMGANLKATDKLNGGTGNDTLYLDGDYNLTFNATTITSVESIAVAGGHNYNLTSDTATVAAGKSLLIDSTALNSDDTLTFNGTAETDGTFVLTGGAGTDIFTGGTGNDTLNSSDGDDVLNISRGGNDIVNAGSGNDTINAGAAFTASDVIDGGDGSDTLNLAGTTSVVLGATTLTNVETINLGTGFSYSLTSNSTTVSGNDTLTVDGSALAGGNSFTFNGAAETDGTFTLIGGAGTNTLTGGAGADTFIGGAGANILTGGTGDDSFEMGANLKVADKITGGTGNDTLYLDGNYSMNLSSTTVTGVETFVLAGGHNYNIVSNDSTVATGQYLVVDGSSLASGDSFTFNGAAETTGYFAFIGSAGTDTLTGGKNADVFNMGANLAATDTITGGTGYDTLRLNGDYNLTFSATTVTGVEEIDLGSGHNYSLTTNNATVATGVTLVVNAAGVGVSDSVTFDGSAETNGNFNFLGGAGSNILTGGALDDVFHMGANLKATDRLNGGGGNDTLYLDGDYNLTFNSTVTGVEGIVLAGGHNYNLTSDNPTVATAKSLVIDSSALGSNDTLTFNGAAETNGYFILTGGVGHDVFTGGAGNDTLNSGDGDDVLNISKGGNDIVNAGSGNDTINAGAGLNASDAINGGDGFDTLNLSGTTTVVLGVTTLTNVEAITLGAGFNYSLTSNDATVSSGTTLTVDGSLLASGNSFTFNGAAETDGTFALLGGAGVDTLTGGSGNDLFIMGANLQATDKITGGAGYDGLRLDGNYSLTFGASTVTGVDEIDLAAGHNYSLTSNDATVAASDTLRVDGSAVGVGNSITFNGAAETNGIFTFISGAGTNNLTGGAGADTFFGISGANNLTGGNGNDAFVMGANLKVSDKITGGGGNDTLYLNGDYSLALNATTVTGVETFVLAGGHNYNIVTNNATVATGVSLAVDASAVGVGNSVTFDGTAETTGTFSFTGGAGSNILTGGTGDDSFDMGANLKVADKITGGAGNDTLYLNGNYNMTLSATTVTGVEAFVLAGGHNYNITTNNATVSSGKALTVDGSALGAGDSLIFNGAAETNGFFAFVGGAGADILTGGTGKDSFIGGLGADTMTGGAGVDTFTYTGVADSSSAGYDSVVGFSFSQDIFAMPSAVGAVNATVTASLSSASFDNDLTSAITATQLGAGNALLFKANAGTLSGHTFLIVDGNATAGYQAGSDYVVDLVSVGTGTLSTANFAVGT